MATANTYYKWRPNVYLAKCEEQHAKGDVIEVTTQYGKVHECVVFNFVVKGKSGANYYSVVRADGFNYQTYCKEKAERYERWSRSASVKSEQRFDSAHRTIENIVPGQPILVDHYSAKGHIGTLLKHDNQMRTAFELREKAVSHSDKADYWASKADSINLSMPESIEYYEHELELATAHHKGLKDGTIERTHGMSLQYANKKVKELTQKVADAKTLWG